MHSLLSNKTNLFSTLVEFIKESESVIIYSAFIKDSLLKEIIAKSEERIRQIIVRWQVYDLIMGVSDLDIYETCLENNITLYRNTKLHAKCIINQDNDCILGSSNYTNNGMLHFPNSNWEINTRVNDIDVESQLVLKRILQDSILVTQQWVNDTRMKIEKHAIELPEIELPGQQNDKDFLLSALPLSRSPSRLFEIMNDLVKEPLDNLEKEASLHDMALYEMQLTDLENLDVFLDTLRKMFLEHPFIIAFLDFLNSKESNICGFTEACKWIASNCEDVPIPTRFTIRDGEFVDPLFMWCAFFIENIRNENRYAQNSGSNQLVIL